MAFDDDDDDAGSWIKIEIESDKAGGECADATMSYLSQNLPHEAVRSLTEGIKHFSWRAIARSNFKLPKIIPSPRLSGNPSREGLGIVYSTLDEASTTTVEAELARKDAESNATIGTHESSITQCLEPELYPPEIAQDLHEVFHDSTLLPCACTPRKFALTDQQECTLKLDGSWNVAGNTRHYFFDAVLAADDKYDWKKIQFRIPRKETKVGFDIQDHKQNTETSPTIRASQEPGSRTNVAEEPDEDVMSLTDYCVLFEEQTFDLTMPVQLERGPSGFSFYQLNYVPIQVQPKDSLPPVSVSEAIQEHKISLRSRISLAFVLAKTFWQFYASRWMQSAWDFQTIVLLPQSLVSQSLEVEAQTPFLSIKTKISEDQQPAGSENPDSLHPTKARIIWHPCPYILNLGLLLVLLGTKEGSAGTELKTRNSEYSFCRSKVKDTLNWPQFGSEQIREEYRTIVRHCIPESRKDISNNPTERRQALLDEVARPLFKLLQRMHDPIKDEPLLEPVGGDQHSRPRPGQIDDKRSRDAKTWFDDLDELTTTLSSYKRKDKVACPPSKIAILDTGVTTECYGRYERSIHGYKDFVSNIDDSPQDGTGHGTSVLRLLLKLYEDAEVYVGRVFQRQDADDQTERLMAEAIHHAKSVWKVDVICIPSGFNQADRFRPYRDSMYEAVVARPSQEDGLSRPGSLIFAAASNLGLASSVTYPGCLSKSSKVLCFFSTSADGNPNTPGFNPAAVPSTYNLALLGEDIRIDPNDKPVRGSSFSTIIAGAIAAHILDFSNHEDVRDQITDVRYLREVEGMTSVFASMRSVKSNGYLVLEPWNLQAHNRREELDVSELRQEICRKLSDALASRDSRKYDY
ncbi:unnamed protein product [Alternaria alternata]